MFSFSLPYASTGASGRTVVWASITLSGVTVPTATGSAIAPCTLASSIETFDNATGVTHAFAAGVTPQGPAGVLRQAQPAAVP